MLINNKPQWLLALAGWVLAAGLLFLVWRALERLGSGSGAQGAAESQSPENSPYATDPVNGEKLTKGAPNVRALYQGKEYWFVRPQNKMTFLADPERYLSNKPLFPALGPSAVPALAATPMPLVQITVEPKPPASKAPAITEPKVKK